MLKTGAILNFLIAAGHLLCLPWLDAALRLYRMDSIMGEVARYGLALPYLLTIGVAMIFGLFGLYGLSADGAIRPLPLLRIGIYAIAVTFLLRAASGIAEMAVTENHPTTELSAAAVATLIGLLYLLGGLRKFRKPTVR